MSGSIITQDSENTKPLSQDIDKWNRLEQMNTKSYTPNIVNLDISSLISLVRFESLQIMFH
jgi:hypothetical protein